jgi:uncharacterized membrane protein YcaP (DUF421 family)
MLCDSVTGLARVILLGASAYLALITILRISGKRTLAKMNAFDLVVTIALGSTLATILLTKDVALAEGVIGFTVLVLLQFVIAFLAIRYRWVEQLVKSRARILLQDGAIDHRALRKERVTESEIHCAVRSAGLGDLSKVAAVVLETDGSLSVVAVADAGDRSALRSIKGGDL